jgi:catechol 2,3-dioxygenase-like lactoylglutathione lyase family enzyme
MQPSTHGLQSVKGIALSVTDRKRAEQFYGETLGLPPIYENGILKGFLLEQTILMLKDDWYGVPTAEPNPRITLISSHAPDTEAFLQTRGVTIADPVQVYDNSSYIGSFLDSEGNKLWFCSPVEKQ